MLLENKCCVITGAASRRGLGLATAKLFASHGAIVAILDLDAEQAKSAAAEVGNQHIGVACNVTDLEQCGAAIAAVLEALGQVDVLVNNAGITQPLKLMDIKPENYDAVPDVNLRGTLYMSPGGRSRTCASASSGSIVCMSSVSAQRGGGIFGGPHYSAAKAGVLGLAKAMARELGPDGIRVNSITPGLIQTDITAGKLTDEMRAEILERHSARTARRGRRRRRRLPVPGLGPVRLHHRRRHRRQRRHAHSLNRTRSGRRRRNTCVNAHRAEQRSNVSLAERAYRIRRNALRMGEVQGQGYIAQALDIADVLGRRLLPRHALPPGRPGLGRA